MQKRNTNWHPLKLTSEFEAGTLNEKPSNLLIKWCASNNLRIKYII